VRGHLQEIDILVRPPGEGPAAPPPVDDSQLAL